MRSHYRLSCLSCGKVFEDPAEPFLLACDQPHGPSLLRADYEERELPVDAGEAGLFRYRRWLPIRKTWPSAGGPVVFQSRGLAAHLKLDALFLGFIHICFDVRGMEGLKRRCEAAGFPFTVDTAQAFLMGEASGRFAYLEDPGGTLVELVETYRLAILRKLGWFLDLRRRSPEKRLPGWMLRSLAFNRVRERGESPK